MQRPQSPSGNNGKLRWLTLLLKAIGGKCQICHFCYCNQYGTPWRPLLRLPLEGLLDPAVILIWCCLHGPL